MDRTGAEQIQRRPRGRHGHRILVVLLGILALRGPTDLGSSPRPAAGGAAEEATGRAAVVFVPGVTGSRLEDTGSGAVLWGDASNVFSPRDRGHSTALPLTAGPAPDDGVRATGVLSHLRLLAYTREVYRPLRRALEEAGYRTGDLDQPSPEADLYFFAYDWRRENRIAVTELHDALVRLARRRGPAVRLVCQSNAGRICRYLAKYGESRLEPGRTDAESLGDLPSPPYRIEQLVLVSNSHGGSLRQLHELHHGRRYVPGIGRFMAPEALFAIRSLFEDLPFHRTDLFLDEDGVALDVDLFDASNWRRYGWSVFRPGIEEQLSGTPDADLFGDADARERYLAARLAEARRVNELLLRDSPRFEAGVCLLQNFGTPTVERALLLEGRRPGEWHLRFAGERDVPPELEERLSEPGDGHGTRTSQEFLSAQEQEAVQARHRVEGGHFDTITRPETLALVLECLSLPAPDPGPDPDPGTDARERAGGGG